MRAATQSTFQQNFKSADTFLEFINNKNNKNNNDDDNNENDYDD